MAPLYIEIPFQNPTRTWASLISYKPWVQLVNFLFLSLFFSPGTFSDIERWDNQECLILLLLYFCRCFLHLHRIPSFSESKDYPFLHMGVSVEDSNIWQGNQCTSCYLHIIEGLIVMSVLRIMLFSILSHTILLWFAWILSGHLAKVSLSSPQNYSRLRPADCKLRDVRQ